MTDAEFYRLQSVLDSRARGKRQGRDGRNVANLFGRLLVNGYDQSTMTLVQKRASNVNLVSMAAQRGLAGSVKTSFPYPIFERAFLKWVAEIEVSNRRDSKSSKLDKRLSALSAVVGKIEYTERKLTEADGEQFERLVDLLARLNGEEKKLKSDIQNEKMNAAAPTIGTAEVVSLVDQLARAKGDELTALRSRLRLAIATVVERIELFPAVGASALVRQGACIVTLRNGLSRVYHLRAERGREPITAGWLGRSEPHALGGDGYRSMVGRLAHSLAAMSYAEYSEMLTANNAVVPSWG